MALVMLCSAPPSLKPRPSRLQSRITHGDRPVGFGVENQRCAGSDRPSVRWRRPARRYFAGRRFRLRSSYADEFILARQHKFTCPVQSTGCRTAPVSTLLTVPVTPGAVVMNDDVAAMFRMLVFEVVGGARVAGEYYAARGDRESRTCERGTVGQYQRIDGQRGGERLIGGDVEVAARIGLGHVR